MVHIILGIFSQLIGNWQSLEAGKNSFLLSFIIFVFTCFGCIVSSFNLLLCLGLISLLNVSLDIAQ